MSRGPHGPLVFGLPDTGGGPGPGLFGSEAQSGARTTPAVTASPAYANYFNFNTSALVGGTYYVQVMFSLTCSFSTTDAGARVLVNGGVRLTEELPSPLGGSPVLFTPSFTQVFGAGNQLISLEFAQFTIGTVTAEECEVMLWRFS